MSAIEDPEEDFVPVSEKLCRERILHTLSIWPKISPSMLQVGIGTAIPPVLWRPELKKLIDEGVVRKYEVSGKGISGRDQVYTIVTLAEVNSQK